MCNHAYGPVETPNATRSTYIRRCILCREERVVQGSEFGTVVPGTILRFPTRTFGSMTRRQIRRFLGLPRNVTFLHSWQDNSVWIVVPPAAEADTRPESDTTDEFGQES